MLFNNFLFLLTQSKTSYIYLLLLWQTPAEFINVPFGQTQVLLIITLGESQLKQDDDVDPSHSKQLELHPKKIFLLIFHKGKNN